jgi:hypothetical protein
LSQSIRGDLKEIAGRAIKFLPAIVQVPINIALDHRRHHGSIPNLLNPRSFNEKIQWMKLFNRDPRLPIYADKIAVKKVIAEKIGNEWIIPTLWIGDDPAQIPFAELMPPYVIKTNQGSGTHYFAHTAEDVDPDKICGLLGQWLRSNQGIYCYEWHYLAIKPEILIEPLLTVAGKLPWDFKFHVFNGKVHFIQVDIDRFTHYQNTFFDTHWRQQEFWIGRGPRATLQIRRPPHLSEMIAAAEAIGREFSFARVDFYDLPQGPKFGEVTFFPGGGQEVFNPREVDRLFGELWELPRPELSALANPVKVRGYVLLKWPLYSAFVCCLSMNKLG